MTRLTVYLSVIITLLFASMAAAVDNPWLEIRKDRIHQLLPMAMEESGVTSWLVICRENDNDPLAKHVGCENAGKTAAFLFHNGVEGFTSTAYSPIGEATALRDMEVVAEVIDVARNASAIDMVAQRIHELGIKTLAVNISQTNPQADGLSHTQYKTLVQALHDASSLEGVSSPVTLVSSEPLVYEWLAVKLPAEVEIMQKAAALTAKWQLEAYAMVIPGQTKDSDVAKYLKQKMVEAGVTDAWAPDQNPNVVSGTDRGHSQATDKVIMPGDVIQTDFGIRVYDTWVTDIQRFTYVLRPGEMAPPEDIAYYWESAKQGRDAAFAAMKPGNTGQQVDAAQRKVMRDTNSRSVMWSTGHPVGYVAHDTGPAFSDGLKESPRSAALRTLKPGMTFAFDGFHSWLMADGNPKTISVEEMVVITENGAKYLVPPQIDLVLIPSAELE